MRWPSGSAAVYRRLTSYVRPGGLAPGEQAQPNAPFPLRKCNSLKLIATARHKEEAIGPIARQPFRSLHRMRYWSSLRRFVKHLDSALPVMYHAPLHTGLSVLLGNSGVN